MTRSWLGPVGAGLLVSFLAGCGHSEEEWRAQLDKYEKLSALNNDTKRKLAETAEQLQGEKDRAAKLAHDLEAMGIDMKKLGADLDSRTTEVGKLSATQKDLESALAEYKKRADQLERIKQRFEQLRKKLETLTSLGLSYLFSQSTAPTSVIDRVQPAETVPAPVG